MTQLLYAAAPHLRTSDSTFKRMWIWNIALLLVAAGALYSFGGRAFLLMLFSVLGAASGEACGGFLFRKRSMVPDGKSVYIGLLSAFLFTPETALWIAFSSAFLGTLFAQECFGGLGACIFHPALAAFALARVFSPAQGTVPSGSAFLFQIAEGTDLRLNVLDFLWGVRSGTLGEASLVMTLAGAILLLSTRMISLRPPALFLGSVLGASIVLHVNPVTEILIGSTLLIAFFLVTDYETSPLNRYGKYAYSAVCGFSAVVLRHWFGNPDAAFLILLVLNGFSPLLDQWFGLFRNERGLKS